MQVNPTPNNKEFEAWKKVAKQTQRRDTSDEEEVAKIIQKAWEKVQKEIIEQSDNFENMKNTVPAPSKFEVIQPTPRSSKLEIPPAEQQIAERSDLKQQQTARSMQDAPPLGPPGNTNIANIAAQEPEETSNKEQGSFFTIVAAQKPEKTSSKEKYEEKGGFFAKLVDSLKELGETIKKCFTGDEDNKYERKSSYFD
ncbi:MAG: hypothetical protein A3F46_08050 [Legionellales bacterium RIFCSPHIGHO2_12_FULL_42_9]|nr:MAG: hypothetical protein A3F46_08050 [Legionellales bacterium RIFCSPHIGHO2_12_FULL_42_9]